MELNELIAKYGLMGVHEKTTISIDILDKLLNEDFEDMGRVRALGFVSIIKREYDIELTNLEKSIRTYFESNVEEYDEPLLIPVDKTKVDTSKFQWRWIIILALLGGLWYLYSHNKLGENFNYHEKNTNEINGSEQLNNNISDEVAQKNVTVNSHEKKITIQTPNDIPTSTKEDNTPQEREQNKTITTTNSEGKKVTVNPPPSNKVIVSNDKKNNKTVEEDDIIDKALDEHIKNDDEVVKSDTKKVNNEEEETVDIIYSITVKPRLNLWFGFINLNTNEKREYTTPNSTTLNINEQRWLLITGHGRVTIITDSETLRISDKRKHFFYIDNTGVREIDYAEFKELNGGRGW